MSGKGIMSRIEASAVLTILGIIFLFSFPVVVTLILPNFVDSSWLEPASEYQVQMYEVADPHIYISTSHTGSKDIQTVYHLKDGLSLLCFQESDLEYIVAPSSLRKYINKAEAREIVLTSKLLLLREPKQDLVQGDFNGYEEATRLRENLMQAWLTKHPNFKNQGMQKPFYRILELYEPKKSESFALYNSDGITESWLDGSYKILESPAKLSEEDQALREKYHGNKGVLYVKNPKEFRLRSYRFAGQEYWQYDPKGKAIASLKDLQEDTLKFVSRKKLIEKGEAIYAEEGCWYCHTDQTRTLVQDVVLNGSAAYPAPPSQANEYVYQNKTFPGTRRIGPDMSRVGIKRQSRDWHKAHFWDPRTKSPGSIMPSFHHFFDDDPRGTSKSPYGLPNHKFEAIFQYLMTKGTRIHAPTQAWWEGKDPAQTLEIIEGRKTLKDS